MMNVLIAVTSNEVKLQAILWGLSIVGTWILTRLKRKGRELPATFQRLLDEGLTYEDL